MQGFQANFQVDMLKTLAPLASSMMRSSKTLDSKFSKNFNEGQRGGFLTKFQNEMNLLSWGGFLELTEFTSLLLHRDKRQGVAQVRQENQKH